MAAWFWEVCKVWGFIYDQINLPVDGKNQGGGVGLATLPLLVIPKTRNILESVAELVGHSHGCFSFFIQRYLTNKDKIHSRRVRHFRRLKTEVFDKWAYPNTQLYEHKNAFSPSFIACYTNISDVYIKDNNTGICHSIPSPNALALSVIFLTARTETPFAA